MNRDGRKTPESGMSPQRWALWRLDDNGNRFLMESFDSRERAESAARDYTARGHKQAYWVEPVSDSGNERAAAGG
jgi:hypothetical protein